MKMSSILLFFLVVFAPGAATAGDGPDLTAYIESIRASGMSENASMQIGSVASILAGGTVLSYQKDPESGRYWGSYMSTTCPNPNADPPELTRWKQLKTDDTSKVRQQLRPFADADGSGFVTTSEGSDFRYLLEFGYLAAQAIRDDGATIEAVSRADGKDIAATEARLRKYLALSKQLSDAGVKGLPEVAIPGFAAEPSTQN